MQYATQPPSVVFRNRSGPLKSTSDSILHETPVYKTNMCQTLKIERGAMHGFWSPTTRPPLHDESSL